MYLDNYIKEITELCKQNGVRTLYVFGSVLTDKFHSKSDIDFLIDINAPNPLDYGKKYFNLIYALEDLLKRPVDLLEEKSLRNKYLIEELNETKSLVYAA